MNRSIVGQILNYFKKKKVKRKRKKVVRKKKRIARKKKRQVLKTKKIKVMSRRSRRKAKRKTRKSRRKRIVIGGIKVRKRRVDRWKKKGKLTKKLKRVKKRRKTIVSVIIAPLRPLRKPMIKALNRKGVKTDKMKFVDIVTKFYNEFVSKKNNKTSTYEPINDNFLSDHYLNETDNYDENSDHLAGVTIGGIVTAVVSFFKKVKDKKKQGLKLLGSEESIAADTKAVEDELKRKEANEMPVKQKQMKQTIMYVLIVIVVGIIIYMVKNK